MSRGWLVWLVVELLASTVFASETPVKSNCKQWRDGAWYIAETDSFFVCSTDPDQAKPLAVRCEEETFRLRKRWFGNEKTVVWSPKCHVVVHDSAEKYVQEVGQGSSAGASLIDRREGRISARRIDLRADHPHGFADALTHELTHLIIADRFVDRRTPPWADEGMAVLGDSGRKQALHNADLARAISRGRLFDVEQLVHLTEPAGAEQWPVFYAQSLSLVRFLVARGDEPKFIRFLEDARRESYDQALVRHYDFKDLADLEQSWLISAQQDRSLAWRD